MSTFWRELHKLMGMTLLMSTAFHPQTDGATEWANHSIGQVLRMIIQDDQKDWAAKCPMVEFALNSNVIATTGFAPFELNQGYLPQVGMPTLFDTKFKGVKQFALQVKWELMAAHDTIIANCIQQMFHTNKKHHASDEYNMGDHVYLPTQNLTLPKGGKAWPFFIFWLDLPDVASDSESERSNRSPWSIGVLLSCFCRTASSLWRLTSLASSSVIFELACKMPETKLSGFSRHSLKVHSPNIHLRIRSTLL